MALMNLLLGVALPSSSFVTLAASIPHCVVKSDRLSLEPEKATKAPRNSGTDPSTMKMKKWYQGQDRLSDKSQWQLPSNRMNDKKAPSGTDRASCQARESNEGDKENELPIQKFENTEQCMTSNVTLKKMHRATYEDAYTRAWFDYCRSVFPQSVRKAGPTVDLYNVSRTSAASSSTTWVPSTGRVNFG